ncbi:MAG TPA: hypothetical protein VIK81_03005 [Patescibacteria group bacterium]
MGKANLFLAKIKEVQTPVIIVASSYALVLSVMMVSQFLLPDSRVGSIGLFKSFNIWDGPHYLEIAEKGYEPIFTGFFPVFPILIWLVQKITQLTFLASGLLVSSLSALLTSVVLYKLVLLDESKNTALFIILLIFLFPTAFFFFAPYSESIFLLLVALTFYLLRTKNFLLAFLVASLVTATRIVGLAIVPAIIAELLFYNRSLIRQQPAILILALTIPPLGFLYYLLLNFQTTGNPFYFSYINKINWHSTFSPLGQGFIGAIKAVEWRSGTELLTLGYAQIGAAILAITSIIYSFFKLRISYFVFIAFGFFFIWSVSYWISAPRYIMVLFPIFIFLARMCKYPIFKFSWLIFSIIFFVWLTFIAVQHGPLF